MGRTRSVAGVCQNSQVCNDDRNASPGHAALTRSIRTSRGFYGLRHTDSGGTIGLSLVRFALRTSAFDPKPTFRDSRPERHLCQVATKTNLHGEKKALYPASIVILSTQPNLYNDNQPC